MLCWSCVEVPGTYVFFFLLSPTRNSQHLEKSACSCNSKANDAWGHPKSYQPISLLCVPYKILKRFIYACIKPVIKPLLPRKQAGI